MAELLNKIPTNLTEYPNSFKRQGAFPLEAYEVFYATETATALEAAKAYAESDPLAYVGQKLSVVHDSTVTVYVIENEAGALKKVGTSPVGDEKSITVAEDGTVSLYGIAGLEFEDEDGNAINYQPLLVDGKLTWVIPSATTVEGLASEIEGLKTRISTLESTVGDAESGLVKNVADLATADTALGNRITAIEDDYLKTADKTALETAISTAKTEAVEEAVATVLGEGTSEDFDTLKEVADWILSDTTGAAALMTRVTTIENDYLKGADKTGLQDAIDDLEAFVGTLPEGATSTTVVAYIQEVVDGLKIGDYAKAADLTALTERVTAIETAITDLTDRITALEEVGAEKNVINSADDNEFTVDADRKLGIKAVVMEKVTGLPEALAQKVTAQDGYRLISESEAEKLEKLVLSEDGSVEVSGTIAAGNVEGLDEWITARAGTLKGLSENNLTDDLKAQIEKSQSNVIEIVKVGGVEVEVNAEDKSVNIPMATALALGVVKGTDAENGVAIAEDGTMSVNSVNVNKLVQTDGDTIVLDGGSSAD